MRVDLPSGAWVEIREEFTGLDRKKVRKAVKLAITRDGVQEMDGDVDDVMRDALMIEAMTAWSLSDKGIALPSVPRPLPNGGVGIDKNLIARSFSDVDYAALQDAVQPVLERILGRQANPPSGDGGSAS